jgi:DNA-binding NarL/FixJ family response regulator
MIRVLLVDDHASFRQPLAFLLAREPDIAVAGQAGSLAEARRMLEGVEVAVVDLGLPDGEGVELVRELRAANPRGAVLILTASLDRREHARAVEAGASGVLHKSAEIGDVIAAVRRLAAGELLLSRQELVELLGIAGQQQAHDQAARLALRQLTPREQQVLHALAEGLSDKEIAQRLWLSPQTARNHMLNILGKLGVHSRVQALVFAIRHGIITIR